MTEISVAVRGRDKQEGGIPKGQEKTSRDRESVHYLACDDGVTVYTHTKT